MQPQASPARGRRRISLVLLVVLLVALGATGKQAAAANIPAGLLAAAQANPAAIFHVIVETPTGSTENVIGYVRNALDAQGESGEGITRRFRSINGLAATLSGKQLLHLVKHDPSLTIVPDAPVVLSSLSTRQQWPHASRVTASWPSAETSSRSMPAIAIVDSGIDATLPDFGARVLEQVDLTSLPGNSPGDGRGHGTFVAAIAAGEARGYAGAAPGANLVSLDVMDDRGMALTSDVIAAADWILANKDRLGIRVANFSLHSEARSTIFTSPLDRAVERLWFSGVVVVTSAGNYGVAGTPQEVATAPGNDPFVITVGASDIGGTVSSQNDVAAPWSAFGHTPDGFAKPELSAPGRYMVAALPSSSTLAAERLDRMVAPGYYQLSGTSFAAPVVAGAAAYLLAMHPGWTPDDVKGALMLTAQAVPAATAWSLGVGEIDANAAAEAIAPPNPNAALDAFVGSDPSGGPVPVFDAVAWQLAARGDANWSDANWSDANWSDANWSDASWDAASWETANWSDASWSDASWSDASWSDANWSDANWADGALDDVLTLGGYWLADDPTYTDPAPSDGGSSDTTGGAGG
jgi:serine protease AprX